MHLDKTKKSTFVDFHILCPRRDSNSHGLRHTILSRACIPIPPLGPVSRKSIKLQVKSPRNLFA